MFNNELLKDIQKRTQDLHEYLEIEQKEIEVQTEEEHAASPEKHQIVMTDSIPHFSIMQRIF